MVAGEVPQEHGMKMKRRKEGTRKENQDESRSRGGRKGEEEEEEEAVVSENEIRLMDNLMQEKV